MTKFYSLSDYIKDRNFDPNPQPLYWSDTMPGGFEMSTYALATPFYLHLQTDTQFGPASNVMMHLKCNFGQMMWLNFATYAQIAPYRKIDKDTLWQLSAVCSTDCSFTINLTGMNSDYSRETNHYGVLNFRICDGEIVFFKNKLLLSGMHGFKFDVAFETDQVIPMPEGKILPIRSMDYGRARNEAYNQRPTISIAYGEE
ncbi:MAG: hypothetical protein JAY74_19855 [Candidatus Thiodiazotropha taylori]|nr:hypothetical protein [Candidatus Thiodiazotropha taylori]